MQQDEKIYLSAFTLSPEKFGKGADIFPLMATFAK